MKCRSILLGFLVAGLFQSCNTLYNSTAINLEIVEPGRVIFPAGVQTIAVRYNNSNISYNPYFAQYLNGLNTMTDERNNDSIASKVYYSSFIKQLQNSILFDSVYEVKPADYSGFIFDVSAVGSYNSLTNGDYNATQLAVPALADLHTECTPPPENPKSILKLDPEYGLYSEENLQEIADSTGAEMFLSLDYFSVHEAMDHHSKSMDYCIEYVLAFWNFYNLQEKKLQYFYKRTDTISWTRYYGSMDEKLPRREVAMMKAAGISGENFSYYLAPHWIEVQRTLYKSGHIELKKANELAKNNKWLKAAEIWKKNVNNQNKSVAAKSMFNLAVACEIEGNIDAALDWIVKSYHIFGQKNEVHEFNCRDYLHILAQRKLDFKKIDLQFNPNNAEL